MASTNATKAATALANSDLRGMRPAGELDASLNSEHPPKAQERKRIHRSGGLSRSEERHRLTRTAALRLAESIRRYWQAQGHNVRCWIEPIDGTTEWAVRSTLALSAGEPPAKPFSPLARERV